MIQISHLNKYFNRHKENEIHVIHDTSITFEDHGLVCILGESGSGKTTFLNTIGGLDSFQSGSIQIDDIEITKYNYRVCDKLRNEKYGYIFQNYYLLQDRSVWYNIELVLNIYSLSEEEKKKRINYVLQAVGMLKYQKKMINELSGGQMQRVAIARALVKSPKIIFADEPTGNLDSKNTIQIMNIIKKISNDCLVILVTHEKNIANFYADRILTIYDGSIIKDEVITQKDSLSYIDDDTLYLKEYPVKSEIVQKGISLSCYQKEEEVPNLCCTIVYEHGQFFIDAKTSSPVIFVNDNNSLTMKNESKPVLSTEDTANFNYHLEPLHSKKSSKLSFRETLKLAKMNLASLRKKQFFLFLSLVVMAVLICISTNDFLTVSSVHPENVVLNDSRVSQVEYFTNGYIPNGLFQNAFNTLYQQVKQANLGELIPSNQTKLIYTYNIIPQVSNSKLELNGFDYLPLSYLSEKDITYGRMPQAYNEIVLDEWVAQKALTQKTITSQLLNSMEDLIGLDLQVDQKKLTLKVVGICQSKNMATYINPYLLCSLPSYAKNGYELSRYLEMYPDNTIERFCDNNGKRVSTLSLSEHANGDIDVVCDYETWKSVRYTNFELKILSSSITYHVVGYYLNNFHNIQVLFPDSYYQNYCDLLIQYKKSFKLISNDLAAVKTYFKDNNISLSIHDETSLDSDSLTTVNIRITKNFFYEEQMNDYLKDLVKKRNARFLVTLTVFLSTVLILYFTMKSSAIKKIYDIGVYRSIGINKNSILGLFSLQIIIISLCTSLPTVLGTTLVYALLKTIPSITISVYLTFPILVLILLFLFLINLFIGLLPIFNLLRYPPAALNAKYDI